MGCTACRPRARRAARQVHLRRPVARPQAAGILLLFWVSKSKVDRAVLVARTETATFRLAGKLAAAVTTVAVWLTEMAGDPRAMWN